MEVCIKRKKRRPWKLIVVLAVVAAIAAGLTVYGRKNFLDYVTTYSVADVKSKVVSTLNDATSQALSRAEIYGGYDKFVRVEKTAGGDVAMINLDMLLVNLFVCDVLEFTQDNLDALRKNSGLTVPVAAITGSALLAQNGAEMTIELLPAGNIDCRFRSVFESRGINQTLHTLYLDIVADVKMMLPLYAEDFLIESTMIVYENLIVGKVPDVYFAGSGGSVVLEKNTGR